jgi:ABC-2 type transport system permease protein
MKDHFLWSVRREFWESRFLYVVPLVAAALVLIGFLFNVRNLPQSVRALSVLDPAKQVVAVVTPYGLAASVILFSGIIVAVFYCLDALSSERRDRSILFWKSMPVSDLTTVLSKASIPLAVLPLLTFAIAFVAQAIMLSLSSAVLLGNGLNPATQWMRLPFFQMSLAMLYGLIVHALWYAPIYAWLLAVSAWARRWPFLWAVLPILAILVVERMVLGTSWFASLLRYRLFGAMVEAFGVDAMRSPITQLAQLEPLRFLSSPGLWGGLAFAAILLFATVRLRRYREPM